MSQTLQRPISSCSQRSDTSQKIREVSKTLTAERREKLLALQRREKMKEVLIRKFKKTNDCSDSVIDKEVSNFCKKAKITEKNLNRLERRIRNRAKKDKDEEGPEEDEEGYNSDQAIPEDAVSNYSMPSLAPSMAGSHISRTSSVGELYKLGRRPDDYNWSRLDEYAKFVHSEEASHQKLAGKEMKDRLKSYLDGQVADRDRRKEKLVQDEQRYYDNLLIQLEDWEINERQKRDEVTTKMESEKKSRDSQLQYNQLLKENERLRREEEESAVMKQIEAEIKEERERLDRKKEDEKQAILKVFRENMEDKKRRDEEAESRRLAELEQQQEIQRMEAIAEEKRLEEVAERDARQKTLLEKMKADVLSAQRAQGTEDEKRAQAQMDEMNTRAAHADSTKIEKLESLRLETQDYLFMQMAEKDSKKRKALELKELQAGVLQKDAEEYKVVQDEKDIQRRLRNLQHRAQLETQIQEKQSRTSKNMSESEITMNLDLIEKVEKTLAERDARLQAQKVKWIF